MSITKNIRPFVSLMLATSLGLQTVVANAQTTAPVGDLGNGASLLPTGLVVTPTAAPGSTFMRLTTGVRADGNADANQGARSVLSPDGTKLLVMSSGYNLNYRNQTTGATITYPVLDPTTGLPGLNTSGQPATTSRAEWVLVYDVTSGTPVQTQRINIPNTFHGIAWAPAGDRFYVAGANDDRVYIYTYNGTQYVPSAPFILLGHNSNQTRPIPTYDGGLLKGTPAASLTTGAVAANLALSKDGNTLFVTNFMNDSLSIVDTQTRQVTREVKFFVPGQTEATGEYPFDVAVRSNGSGGALTAFVTSQRDDEVLAVDAATGTVIRRIPVGNQPNRLLLSKDSYRLYVVNGNSDSISVIDTVNYTVTRTIPLSRPGELYKGANPNALELSPDGRTLYVTLGYENAVAVVNLATGRVVGRIPTSWYPNSVSVSKTGDRLFVVNSKSNSGPNPGQARTTAAGTAANPTFQNQYTWALEKGGLLTVPLPNQSTLASLTQQVNQNNGYANRYRPDLLMAFLRTKIKHVIYIVKENRTYDQVLGDLPVGNGDPTLTLFPDAISPNHHKLALDFVTLDNFYDSGESSGVGWNWSTFARTTDYTEKDQAGNYGNIGGSIPYDAEGSNRRMQLSLPQTAPNPTPLNARLTGVSDPTGSSAILPGTKDVNAPIGDGDLDPDAIGGYLWDSALRAGKTVRNYGFYMSAYSSVPLSPTPFASNIPQAASNKPVLLDKTDIYFRGYDQNNADIYLFNEWKREFDQYVTGNNLPNLSLVRLPHDHFGNFNTALAGLNTPNSQMADNDYAVGRLIETVSKSRYWQDTAIVIVEDDSQNGPDHVDSHRSLAYIISPYTKRGAVVSTNYNQVNILRTMEDLLGIKPLGLLDANALPMSDVFTYTPNFSTYTAIVPGVLCAPPVDPNLVPACADPTAVRTAAKPSLRDGQWWANATKDFDFTVEDKLDADAFNQILWAGIKGDVPYPTARDRKDWRTNRAQLLKGLSFDKR